MDAGDVGYGGTGKLRELSRFRLKLDAGIVLLAFLVVCTVYVLVK